MGFIDWSQGYSWFDRRGIAEQRIILPLAMIGSDVRKDERIKNRKVAPQLCPVCRAQKGTLSD
jgi:hypothetical protein